jgi:hypothetical protein
LGGVTYGGYSESIVVDKGFVLKVSENLNLAAVGTAAVRRNQDLFAAPSLEGKQGPEGRPRRAGTHGGEICKCLWRTRRSVHPLR